MNPFALPKLTKYVNDFSNVLPSSQMENLNTLFIDHEGTTSEQVVTVLFPHRQGNELLDIGLKVFNENGIGQKNLNNGLLLIVATEEKKLRIIVGKGLELKFTEMVCREIVENHLRPLLNEGKYEEMIQVWNNQISERQEQVKNSYVSFSRVVGIIFISIFGILALTLTTVFLSNELYLTIFATKDGLVLGGIFGFAITMTLLSVLRGISRVFTIARWLERKMRILMVASAIIFVGIFWVIGKISQMSCLEIYADTDIIKTSCTRIILGKTLQYTQSEYTVAYKASHPEQFKNSSNSYKSSSSSHSSFGGGGGSSNGGGYGD